MKIITSCSPNTDKTQADIILLYFYFIIFLFFIIEC